MEERLRRAERHVAEGAQHVDRQRLLVEELEGSGQNAATERRILRQLEALQALQVSELGRLRTEALSVWQPASELTLFRPAESA